MRALILILSVVFSASIRASDAIEKFRGELVGEWSLVSGLPCGVADYTYSKDGSFQVLFNENLLTGKYTLSEIDGHIKVVWYFESDDKKKNCSGKDWNLVGKTLTRNLRLSKDSKCLINYGIDDEYESVFRKQENAITNQGTGRTSCARA